MRLPRGPLYPLAYGAEAMARITGREPFLTTDALKMSKYHMFFSSAKARAELGFSARSYVRGIEDAVSWFRAVGYIR
jgi:dihydroflavonol-4-reductase